MNEFKKNNRIQRSAIALAVATAFSSPAVMAVEAATAEKDVEEVIEVTGIRSSLTSAIAEKRDASNLVEVIIADDIGKLPDQNLAEVLENVTGIQITRTAGVGTGVQIRGTDANRTEINGVSTVGSGGGRSGIDFEDVSASIIAAVEVTKSPEAKTTEGSVGGTVNLRTIRPLSLSETLGSVRVQAENSSLSTEALMPRISGTYGDNWELDFGKLGFVVAASYSEQEAVSFRPRADRDNMNEDGQLGINFLLQEQENDDYETYNVASTLEFAPSDEMKFHFDTIINSQEQSRDQYRLQASGVGGLINTNKPTSVETIEFGSIGGVAIPNMEAALKGEINPGVTDGKASEPNLRMSSETGSRVTDSAIFVFGGEYQHDDFRVSAEVSSSKSESTKPKFDTTMNFMNPNSPEVAKVTYQKTGDDGNLLWEMEEDENGNEVQKLKDGNPIAVTSSTDVAIAGDVTDLTSAIASVANSTKGYMLNDNGVPYAYDLSGDTLSFGLNANHAAVPTKNQLLDAKNYYLAKMEKSGDEQVNEETGARFDVEYYIDDNIVTSVDFGYRFNSSSSEYNKFKDTFSTSDQAKSIRGEDIASLLVAGPDNFGDGDDRDLFIKDFLLVDPDRAFSDPEGTLAIIDAAYNKNLGTDPAAEQKATMEVTEDLGAYYLVEEDTHAFYAQANFEWENIRGNIGGRYISTSVDSTGYSNGAFATESGDYSFFLPRLNIVADVADEMIVRIGAGKDIRRPDFSQLNSAFNFGTNENTAVALGNPGLEPEEVISFDISYEWYFAEASVVSVSYFIKERTNIFGTKTYDALSTPSADTTSGFVRETDPTCPGGGLWNPKVVANTLGELGAIGMCVDYTEPGNDSATTTQQGIELAAQYDLSGFEEELGWASGFGVMGNLTIQDYSGGDNKYTTGGRGKNVLGDITADAGLLNFSETAYNLSAYYEKYGISARMRYTWRDAFRSTDFAGGASTGSTLSFPVVTAARGQLNASVSYDVNEKLNIGLEAVNLTKEGVKQYCVNDDALLCFVGLPDRRVTVGATYKF